MGFSIFIFYLNPMSLNHHYLALNVKDIFESYMFYSKLGFNPVPMGGSLDDKWILMQNGNCKIGLYEGMFSRNTMTFNPENAREVYDQIKEDVDIGAASGMDEPSGPCYFMIKDPDGNHILFDQQSD